MFWQTQPGYITGRGALDGAGGGGGGGDSFFSSVKLLMGFNGANGSTGAPGMTDESSAAHGNASVFGGEHIDTAQFKFGASSLRADSGSVQYGDHADWRLSAANSDQFTVECWVRFNTTGTSKVIIAQYTADGTVGWAFQTPGASASEFMFYFSPDGTFASGVAVQSTGAGLTTGAWYHLAADKDSGGKIRIYKDGVMLGSATPANSAIFNSPENLGIGATPAGGGAMDGWIDELRITKGAARYASDSGYTVPTAAFPRS